MRPTHRHRQDARVGDDDVDLAEVGKPGLDGVTQFVALPDVANASHHAAAEFLYGALGLGQVFRSRQRVGIGFDLPTDVDGDDVGTLTRHRHGVRASLTARRSGDERDPTRKPSGHRSSFSKRSRSVVRTMRATQHLFRNTTTVDRGPTRVRWS